LCLGLCEFLHHLRHPCEQTITKTSHGFRKGTPIRWNGSAYVRPANDTLVPDFVVVDSLTANTFKVANCGTYTTSLANGLYWFTSASPGYSLTPDTTKVPLFQVLNTKLILNPIVGFNLMSGSASGDVTSAVLADTAAAIRADFPSGGGSGGSTNQIQINNAGSFAGSSKLVYNTSTDTGFVDGVFRVQDTLKTYRILFPYDQRGLRPGGMAGISVYDSDIAGTGLMDRIFNIGINGINNGAYRTDYPQNTQQFEVDYVTPDLDTLSEWHHTFAQKNSTKSVRAMFMKYYQSTGRTIHETYADDWQIRWAADGNGYNSKTVFDFNVTGGQVTFWPRNLNGTRNSIFFNPTGMILDSANIQIVGRDPAGVAGFGIIGQNKTQYNIGVRGGTAGSPGNFEIRNDGTHLFAMDSIGRIGINRSAPGQMLEIIAPIEQTSAKIALTSQSTGTTGLTMSNQNGLGWDIVTQPNRDLWIYSGRYGNWAGYINGQTGNWGFNNVITATAKVHIGAGTATASTAPFKFTLTSHVQLGTPETGVLEPRTDGYGLLFTDVAGTRKEIQLQSLFSIVANTTLDATHNTVIIPLGSAFTVTLPAASSFTNKIYRIVNKTVGAVTIGSYVNIVGASVTTLALGSSILVQSDGTNWQQIQ